MNLDVSSLKGVWWKKAAPINGHMATVTRQPRCTESHPAVEVQWGCWVAQTGRKTAYTAVKEPERHKTHARTHTQSVPGRSRVFTYCVSTPTRVFRDEQCSIYSALK